MEELIERHVRPGELADLAVGHAELHVRLPVDGRPRDHLVRLWSDRCDIGAGTVGDRILSCLRLWSL